MKVFVNEFDPCYILLITELSTVIYDVCKFVFFWSVVPIDMFNLEFKYFFVNASWLSVGSSRLIILLLFKFKLPVIALVPSIKKRFCIASVNICFSFSILVWYWYGCFIIGCFIENFSHKQTSVGKKFQKYFEIWFICPNNIWKEKSYCHLSQLKMKEPTHQILL